MKMILGLLLFMSVPVLASKPTIARHDMTYATGTGIEDIQFLMGGDEEQISGIVDKEEIRRLIHTNMIGVYRCYAANLKDSKKTGKITINMELRKAKSPSSVARRKPKEVTVLTSDFDSKDFSNCVAEYWSNIPMPTASEDTTSEVVMPIMARLRASDSLEN